MTPKEWVIFVGMEGVLYIYSILKEMKKIYTYQNLFIKIESMEQIDNEKVVLVSSSKCLVGWKSNKRVKWILSPNQ